MAHDIFISYSSKDKQTADAICHVLESNKLKCWIAPRNILAGKNYAEQIMYGLKNAKIVVLVFSKNSQESVFVNNEIDTAFSNNKPIISFKIDETLPEDKMGFFLKNKHWLDAYPNPEAVFETLVRDAYLLCEEEQGEYVEPAAINYNTFNLNENRSLEEKINSSYAGVDIIEMDQGPGEDEGDSEPVAVNEEEDVSDNEIVEQNTTTQESSGGGIGNYKLPIAIGVAIILIAIVGVVLFTGNGDVGSTSSDDIVIDYIDMDDDRKEGYASDYSYIVFGSIPNQENTSSKYVVHADFYDDSGNVVESNDTKVKNLKNNILAAAFVNKNNIVKVKVELRDESGNVISAAESDNIMK